MRGAHSLQVINPPAGRAPTTWESSGPFHLAGRRGTSESPARAGDRQQGGKSPPARGSICNNAGERGAARLPGGGGLRPQEPRAHRARTRALRPPRPTIRGQGPPGRKQRAPSPRPGWPGPSPRTWSAGARSMAPAVATGPLSRCGERLGPLSPWPPARVQTGRQTSAPIGLAPTPSPATPLAEEEAPAPGDGGGGGTFGEGSSGTEAEKSRTEPTRAGGVVGNGGAGEAGQRAERRPTASADARGEQWAERRPRACAGDRGTRAGSPGG